MKKKGFTLIELIAVLVILAILALIVTPLVMSIIRKARVSADKRSIDAYGRSIELAVASYLLDNGDFPTSIEQLTIEYSGDRIECATTQLNTDSSVYLAGCRVAGRTVDYTYGNDKTPASPTYQAYEKGDVIEYNHNTYYVIKDSDETESSLTLLKDVPLLAADINIYSESMESTVGTVGNGTMSYGNSSDYAISDIKTIVDAWANDNTNASDLVIDSMGYSVRLITLDELISNYGFLLNNEATGYKIVGENVPDWLCNSQYSYWTMTPYNDDNYHVWVVGIHYSEAILKDTNYNSFSSVRPVINLKKSALEN